MVGVVLAAQPQSVLEKRVTERYLEALQLAEVAPVQARQSQQDSK